MGYGAYVARQARRGLWGVCCIAGMAEQWFVYFFCAGAVVTTRPGDLSDLSLDELDTLAGWFTKYALYIGRTRCCRA